MNVCLFHTHKIGYYLFFVSLFDGTLFTTVDFSEDMLYINECKCFGMDSNTFYSLSFKYLDDNRILKRYKIAHPWNNRRSSNRTPRKLSYIEYVFIIYVNCPFSSYVARKCRYLSS